MAEKTLFDASLSKAMALCSRMEYCREDIFRKVQSWGIPEAQCEKIMKYLISENFINEERYARAFTRDKFRYNKWGRLKIAAHLKAKKIDGEVIRSALEEISPDEYITMLNNLISSHKKTIKSKDQYDLRAKMFRYASSKGFESSILYDLLNDLSPTPLPE